MQNVFDLIREDEEKSLLQARKEIAEEMRVWNSLSQQEKDEITLVREAKFANCPDSFDDEGREEDEE